MKEMMEHEFEIRTKLSMDELMAKNLPPHMRKTEPTQSVQEPETTTAPIQQPTPQPIVIQCAVPEAMERIERRLKALEKQSNLQTEYLRRLCEKPTAYATQAQMDELLKVVKYLEQMTEQAGKPKEKSSSRYRIRLPRLHQSLPEWDWPTVVTITMALAMLFILWLAGFGGLNMIRQLFR